MSRASPKFLKLARTAAWVASCRDRHDLELGQLPILTVDEHIPVDPADLAFRRLLLVFVDQGLEAFAVDALHIGHGVLAGSDIRVGLVDRRDQRHGIAIGIAKRRGGAERDGEQDEDDDAHGTPHGA